MPIKGGHMFQTRKYSLHFFMSGIIFLLSNVVNAESLIDVNSYRALASDHRAYRVGEPIVVLVIESTKAESMANTGAENNVSVIGNYEDNAGPNKAGLGIGGKNSGAGQTSRQGLAVTQLSTRIAEITDVGLYRIKGEHNLIVNGENQRIVLSGLIRAEDLSKDNTILSNRIAEARIEIIGDGDVNDSQKKSIIYKIFKWLRII